MILNKDAELTGSDILLKNKKKGPDIGSASTNSIPQSSDLSTPSKNKYDLADDATYLSAVERGDMETAQRIVDEQANREGYTVKGSHETHKGGCRIWWAKKRETEQYLQIVNSYAKKIPKHRKRRQKQSKNLLNYLEMQKIM